MDNNSKTGQRILCSSTPATVTCTAHTSDTRLETNVFSHTLSFKVTKLHRSNLNRSNLHRSKLHRPNLHKPEGRQQQKEMEAACVSDCACSIAGWEKGWRGGVQAHLAGAEELLPPQVVGPRCTDCQQAEQVQLIEWVCQLAG